MRTSKRMGSWCLQKQDKRLARGGGRFVCRSVGTQAARRGDGLLSDWRRCCQWTGTKQPPFNASPNPRHIVDYWGMSNGNTCSKPTGDRRRSRVPYARVGVAIISTLVLNTLNFQPDNRDYELYLKCWEDQVSLFYKFTSFVPVLPCFAAIAILMLIVKNGPKHFIHTIVWLSFRDPYNRYLCYS